MDEPDYLKEIIHGIFDQKGMNRLNNFLKSEVGSLNNGKSLENDPLVQIQNSKTIINFEKYQFELHFMSLLK